MKKYIQQLEQEIETSLHRTSNLTPEEEEPIIEEFVRFILSKQREAASTAFWIGFATAYAEADETTADEITKEHLSQYNQK